MTVAEHREHPRHRLGRQAAGRFRLLMPVAACPIPTIRDISASGIRVILDASVTTHQNVVIEYTEPTLKLELQGRVAWCLASEGDTALPENRGRFVVGIQLFSPFLFVSLAGLY